MRLSFLLLIFLILFNGWAGLMQQYDIDDHVGFNAEVGDSGELDDAVNASQSVQTGNPIGSTLIGLYNNLLNTVKGILVGLQPGVQLLINVVPPGPADDVVVWIFTIIPIVVATDFIAIARGVDL